jgi:predicted  nucleic acid-binding Zn-ribbon protein
MAEPKTTTPTDQPAPAEALEGQPVKNTADLDPISLEQALLDVDVANARVVDLTKRLTALTKELRQTTNDLQRAKLRGRRLAAELEEIKGSRAFRSATKAHRVIGAARARLGR